MNGNTDVRDVKLSQLRLSKRKWTVVVAVILAAAALYLGWRYLTHPPRPWIVRWKLDRYLKSESHASDFKVDFPFPSKAEMEKPHAANEVKGGSRTGKAFEVLREEYLHLKLLSVSNENLTLQQAAEAKDFAAAKAEWLRLEQELAPIVDDLWDFQKNLAEQSGTASSGNQLAKARGDFLDSAEKTLSSAPSYEAMYKVIGQELFVAKGLLASDNPEHKRQGITVALTAARHAANYAVNGGVAARIAEGYVLPNLHLANDTNRRSTFNDQNLANQCADIFARNYEYNNAVRTYEAYIANARNPLRTDWAHERIGSTHENAGNLKEALEAYRQIRDTNSYRNVFQRQIPRIERQLKN